MNLKRTFRYYFLKFTRLKGEPRALAWGTAIGIFIGITPTMPLHTVAILLVSIITRTSTIAALLAAFVVSNPLTFVAQYYFSIVIGNMVTPYTLNWESMKSVLDILLSKPGFAKSIEVLCGLGYEALTVLLVGGVILALPFSIAAYFLSLRFFIKVREKRRYKHVLH